MMKLGLFVEGTGHHVAAWRDPDVDPHGRQTLKHYVDIARLAERGKFDLLFMADTNATFGPEENAELTMRQLLRRTVEKTGHCIGVSVDSTGQFHAD